MPEKDTGELPAHMSTKDPPALLADALLEGCQLLPSLCSAAKRSVGLFVDKIQDGAPRTVTRSLVGYRQSDLGTMIHIVVLTSYQDVPRRADSSAFDVLLQPEDEERAAVFRAETEANRALGKHRELGLTTHLTLDRGGRGNDAKVFKTTVGERSKFVVAVDNLFR